MPGAMQSYRTLETLLPMLCLWISLGKLMDEWTVVKWMKRWKERRMCSSFSSSFPRYRCNIYIIPTWCPVPVVGTEITMQGALILKVGGPYNERSLPLASVCKIHEIRNCSTRESVQKT